ncbi:hypothetical protein GPECTOR_4g563 [Gonium pectorale]|uniref:Uncharacterized protein n=1 Tax=Gonium pectorale TaxID=33097 RepID=A0A150GXT4_GONPE|nr:hypothetical protein GPECTOR_4g563 [Gonium pectorale]|eukprot:KXZ54498.1 hypothetical protein GPECTOR_4g563 [Gonium pectorale]
MNRFTNGSPVKADAKESRQNQLETAFQPHLKLSDAGADTRQGPDQPLPAAPPPPPSPPPPADDASAPPGRASPVSFALGPPSAGGSTNASYSALLDTHGSPQLDPAFAQQPAVPEDDVLEILEGEPVGIAPSAAAAAAAAASPPPEFGAPQPPASAATATFPPPIGPVYGVYDPSGAVECLGQPIATPQQQVEEQVYKFATAVAASYALDPASIQAAAEQAIAASGAAAPAPAASAADQPSLAETAAAISAAETAAALLLLSSLQPVEPSPLPAETAEASATQQPSSTATVTDAGAAEMVAPVTNIADQLTAPTAPATGTTSGAGEAEWRPYRTLPARYKTTVEALRSLASARTMEQHWDAAEHLDLEVTWDVPPIYLQGREPMRLAVWLAKWTACVELKPIMVKYEELDSRRTLLELLLESTVSPHRPWWLPVSWLLPRDVTLKANVLLRISKGAAADGSQDVVTLLDGAIHNYPKLPTPIRLINGIAMGYLPAATEALWSPFVGLFGDPSYRNRAEEHPSLLYKATTAAKDAATAAADRTHEAVTSAAGSAKDAVSGAADTAAAAAGKAAGAVGSVTGGEQGGVLGTVKGAVAGAADAVRGAVQEAAGAVKEGAAAGADKVVDVAGRARQAVAGRA